MAAEEQHTPDTPQDDQQDWAELLGTTFAEDATTMERILAKLEEAS